MTISDVAIRRPVFTMTIMLALTVLGLMSLNSLGTDLFPQVNFPVVTVTTVYPGASPDEVERQVTKPIEDAVAGIENLDTVRSFSRESVSTVVVMFKLKADIKDAATDVREKVAAVRARLPASVEDPTISRLDVASAPVMVFVASGESMTPDEVRKITEDDLKPALERVPGVAAITVVGGPEREVQVEVDRRRVAELGLSLTDVIDRLRGENLTIPAGNYKDGPREVAVRLRGDVASAKELSQIIVATTPKGTQIRLAEVAKVFDGFEEMRTRVRANAINAVAFEIQKQSGTNTVEVARSVSAKLEVMKERLPKGYQTRLIMDTSEFIIENTQQIQGHIVFGGIMAILVILVFMLDVRSTFISALALPVSVIGTFFVMDLLGFTLNMMTLMALSLSIGLLIDDAVVVRENIFRYLELGEDPEVAASKGTSEIALAVLATTLTVVAVFIPVAFMQGVVGQFFKQFGFTITAAVLISLLVAFTLDPMLSAKLAVKVDHTKKRFILVRMMEAFHVYLEDVYESILRFATRYRFITVALGAACFVGSIKLLELMGSDFVAYEDRGQFMVNIELPSGTSLEETARLLEPVEKAMLEHEHVITLYSKLGPNTEVNKAQWRVVATPKQDRPGVGLRTVEDFTRETLATLLPKSKVNITPPSFVEGLMEGPPLQVQIRGTDIERLERNAVAIERIVKKIAGLSDIHVEYSPGRPEQLLEVDPRKAAALGIPKAYVARTLRAALEGEHVGSLRLAQGENDEVKIRVRMRGEDRRDVKAIGELKLNTPKGPVPLRDILTSRPGTGPQVIERQDRTRQILVTGVPNGRSLGEILADLEPQLKSFDWGPDGYYMLDGQVKQMRETGEGIGLALILGIVFIYLILAAQFESFIHPLTIMLSLPLAFIGAFVALFMTDNGLAMGANIGMILLMGLVTKNGILLVDAALQLQREGKSARDAAIEAGRKRLRPILMTSVAMVLGMLPTALDTGPGSEFRAPMGIAVIGGVITSTILTLVVVPAVFLWLDKVRNVFGWVVGLFKSKKVAGAASVLVIALGGALYAQHARALAPPAGVVVAQRVEGALTLDEATRRALAASRDIRVALTRIESAKIARKRINTAWQPDVNLIGTYTHNSEEAKFDFGQIVTGITSFIPGLPPIPADQLPPPTIIQKMDTVSAVLSVDQTVFAWSPIELDRAAALGIDAQREAPKAIARELAFRVAEVFYNVQGLDRLEAAAQASMEMADRRIAESRRKKDLGAAVDLDMLRAELEKARADQMSIAAQEGRRQLLEVLGVLIDGDAPMALAPVPAVAPVQGDIDALVEKAVASRPEIAARRKAAEVTRVMVREAELRWLPIVTFGGHVRASDTEGFTGEKITWALNLNLIFPLYDRGERYADMDKLRQELDVLEAELAKAEKDIRDSIRTHRVAVETADKSLLSAARQTELARKTAEVVQRALAAGVITNLEVAEADTNVRLAEENEANLRWRRDLAMLQLRHAAGLLDIPAM